MYGESNIEDISSQKGFLEGEEGTSNDNIQEKKFKERDKERRSQV